MTEEKKKQFKYCLRCGRLLKSEESKRVGMGKVCLEKSKKVPKGQPLFN